MLLHQTLLFPRAGDEITPVLQEVGLVIVRLPHSFGSVLWCFICFMYIFAEIGGSSDIRDSLKEFEASLDLPAGVDFGLQHFSYNNSGVIDLIFRHLNETGFSGITVSPINHYSLIHLNFGSITKSIDLEGERACTSSDNYL